ETSRMTALLVDLGNTRIKWARFDGERLSAPGAAAHSAWRAADYGRRLFGGRAPPDSMLVASVAGARLDRVLAAAARRAGVRAVVRSGRRDSSAARPAPPPSKAHATRPPPSSIGQSRKLALSWGENPWWC